MGEDRPIKLEYDPENIYEFFDLYRRLGKCDVNLGEMGHTFEVDTDSLACFEIGAAPNQIFIRISFKKFEAGFPPDLDFSDYKGIIFGKAVYETALHLSLNMYVGQGDKNDVVPAIDRLFEASQRILDFNLEGEESQEPRIIKAEFTQETIERYSNAADKVEKMMDNAGISPEELQSLEERELSLKEQESLQDMRIDKMLRITENMKAIREYDEEGGPVLQIKESSTLSFSDIGGYARQLAELKEIARVAADLKVAKTYAIQIDRGVLLYGPPGTGKTSAAEALATEVGCPFISVSAASILGKFVGESEKAVKRLFLKAIEVKKELDVPVIVFLLDEVASLLGSHSGSTTKADTNVRNEFLSWMDGANRRQHEDIIEGIVLIGTTNHLEEIPPEFRDRPGRFSKLIRFGYPDEEERAEIARILVSKRNRIAKEAGNEGERIDPAFAGIIASETDEGFVGDKINAILEKALRCAFEERSPVVTQEMLGKAIEFVRAQAKKADKKKVRPIGFGSVKSGA